jgi:hypothetical protein
MLNIKMFDIDPFKDHFFVYNSNASYSIPNLKKQEKKKVHYSQMGIGLKKQLDIAKSLFKHKSMSKIKNNERKFLPVIPVKNFEITSTQFKRFLMIKNNKSEHQKNSYKNIYRKSCIPIFKTSSNFSKFKNSNFIPKKGIHRNSRLSLDFSTLRSVHKTDNYNMTRNMGDERNKIDNLMYKILDNNRSEKSEIKILASKYNKTYILDREKKRRNYINSINNSLVLNNKKMSYDN